MRIQKMTFCHCADAAGVKKWIAFRVFDTCQIRDFFDDAFVLKGERNVGNKLVEFIQGFGSVFFLTKAVEQTHFV